MSAARAQYFHGGQCSWMVLCCRYAWFAPDVSAPIFNWVGAAASLLSSSAPTDVGQVRWLTQLVIPAQDGLHEALAFRCL